MSVSACQNRKGIRVNCVAPGRIGAPEEVASAIDWLLDWGCAIFARNRTRWSGRCTANRWEPGAGQA